MTRDDDRVLAFTRAQLRECRKTWLWWWSSWREHHRQNELRRPSWRVDVEIIAYRHARSEARRYVGLRRRLKDLNKDRAIAHDL